MRDPLFMGTEVKARLDEIYRMLDFSHDQALNAEYTLRMALRAKREIDLLRHGEPSEDQIRERMNHEEHHLQRIHDGWRIVSGRGRNAKAKA